MKYDKLVIFAFVAVLALVYLVEIRILVGFLIKKVRGKPLERRFFRGWRMVFHSLAVIGVLCFLYGYFIGSKCPACKQFGALVPTGKFEKTTGTGVLGIGIRIMDEYRCKYCGHMEWQERSAGGGG